jgi:hypothetical protein
MQGFFSAIVSRLSSPRTSAGADLHVLVAGASQVTPGSAASASAAVVDPITEDDLPLFGRAPAEPDGIRVVPYRPTAPWPAGRMVHPRVYDPFRAFPLRATFLAELIHPRDPRD